jgi:hypothetical protein
MTAAPPLAFPGGRTLAGWWRQLAPYQPRALAVAHLLLHRVEALVRLQRRCPLDPMARLVLETLSLEPPPPLPQIQALLPMERPILRQVLHSLETAGLAQSAGNEVWRPTERGRQAQQHGAYHRSAQERGAFYFLESERPGQTPHFIHLAASTTTPWPVRDGWKFDAGWLMQCFQQSPEWKRRHGFPPEVQEILAPAPANAGETGLAAWQRVILDQPERLLAVVVLAVDKAGGDRLLGFAVQPKGWALNPGMPTFELPLGWTDLFPENVAEPPLDRWRQAWQAWGQNNNITTAELEACQLERRDHRLRVTTSRAVLDRLRAAKSEALKGEAWLLAGEERVRAAALLEIVEGRPRK